MQITFIGDPRGRDPRFMARNRAFKADDPPYISLYGLRFPLNQSVFVPDDSEWAKQFGGKIRGNTHFDVADGGEHAAQAVSSAPQLAGKLDASPGATLGDPLDHDGDGEPGGSLPAEDRGEDLAKLRADAEDLGVKVDMRWGAKRLQAEIDKALNG